MSELKPCPDLRCGRDSAEIFRSGSIPRVRYRVTCLLCGCETKYHRRESDAISAWNNRPAENKIKAQGIREALNYLDSAFASGKIARTGRSFLEEYANKLEGKEL